MDFVLLKAAEDINKIIEGENPNILLQLSDLRDKYIAEFEALESEYFNQQGVEYDCASRY